MEKSPSVSISPVRVDEEDSSEHSHSSQKEIHDTKHFASFRDLEAVHSLLTLNDWCGKQTPASSGPVMTSVCFADENLKSPDIFGRDQARSLDISPQETVPHLQQLALHHHSKERNSFRRR
jgi:hypothetical protein